MIDSIEQDIMLNSLTFSFIKRAQVIDKNEEAIKIRLVIDVDFFVQIYANVATGTYNFVLVLSGQRIYGRDCISRKWHRHPYDAPDLHDVTPNGLRAISIKEFLEEVQEILEREKLL